QGRVRPGAGRPETSRRRLMKCRPWLPWLHLALALSVPANGRAAPPHPGDDAIRRQLEDVLSRPEFSPARPGEPWWLRYLAAFFDWLGALHATAPLLYWLLLGTCVTLLVL